MFSGISLCSHEHVKESTATETAAVLSASKVKEMSRTHHHKGQKTLHNGEDYGARYKCNRHYVNPYGKHGRKIASTERRITSKNIIRKEMVPQ